MPAPVDKQPALAPGKQPWFIASQPLSKKLDLNQQVAIVTGSNVGLGFESCRHLLRAGLSHLIMAVRSEHKGQTAARKLHEEFETAQISVWILDMASYDSVQSFAERCNTLSRIDMVILNAATMAPKFALSMADHETTMQANYYSTALLSLLLIPVLGSEKNKETRQSDVKPVLSVVTSDIGYGAMPEASPILPKSDDPKTFIPFGHYKISKTYLLVFADILAQKVDSTKVVVNQVNPGMTKGTAFFDESPMAMRSAMRVIQTLAANTAEVASQSYVDAVAGQGREAHGSFLSLGALNLLGKIGIVESIGWPSIRYTEEAKEYSERLWLETLKALEGTGAEMVTSQLQSRS